jgi:N-acetyl-gamma-glutamyl-phosphate reductase
LFQNEFEVTRMKPKIFIDGEHGTTGLQIRTRLAGRTDLDMLSIPEAERRNDALREEMLKAADVAILCLPDDAAKQAVAMLEGTNSTCIIDTSTAHRIHPDWAYGFAELDEDQAEKIAAARLVANPGCYPTGAIALIRPLVKAGILPSDYPVSVNAISGYTGGGKQMIAQMENADAPDHIDSPHFLYGLTLAHKHVPDVGDVHAALAAHYAGQDVVEVVPVETSAKLGRIDPTELNDTNRMKLFVFGNDAAGQVNLVAVLDNLGKGASGAAVQNMDLMLSKRAA